MERKYPESTIIQYNLKGLDNCKAFFDKLKAKWGLPHLLKCGLAKETVDKSTGEILHKFTWWTKTLYFPFYDKEGNIIYRYNRLDRPIILLPLWHDTGRKIYRSELNQV
jgi:hypothetical protein